MAAGCAYCRCDELCAGDIVRLDCGSIEAWNQCVPGRSGDPDAATYVVQRNLFAECREKTV